MIGHCGVVSASAVQSLLRELHDFRDTQITCTVRHDEDAAPDDVAGFGNAFDRTATKPEVHRRLPLACRTAIGADKM